MPSPLGTRAGQHVRSRCPLLVLCHGDQETRTRRVAVGHTPRLIVFAQGSPALVCRGVVAPHPVTSRPRITTAPSNPMALRPELPEPMT
jgi:hypothetical protein